MNFQASDITIVSCDSSRAFTDRVINQFSSLYNIPSQGLITQSQEIWFANGEVKTVINESIRKKEVFLIQLLEDPLSSRSINDNFMALLTAVDAIHQADASEINIILPQFPYSRQDRRKGREGITARLCSHILEQLGTSRIFSFDLHAEAIVGFFRRTRLDNLRASGVLIPRIHKLYDNKQFVVVSPDVGGADKANYYAKHFGQELAIMHKVRDYSKENVVSSVKLVGNVKGKDVLIVDDMVDTAGTIVKACYELKDQGANNIVIASTFPFFNGKALEKLDKTFQDGVLHKLLATDAVFWGDHFAKDYPWFEEVSLASVVASLIYNVYNKQSINSLNSVAEEKSGQFE